MIGLLYLERLTGADLAFVAAHAGERRPVGDVVAHLRSEPGRIESALARPALFDALFPGHEESAFASVSPFLTFAVLLARTARELEDVAFVPDWVAPRRWVPVFDAGEVREFAADPARRLFLADLLASYTHVASGTVWVRTGRGWARRRWSELDPVRLAELLDVLPEGERLAVHRRLGDLALFLSGVFPDHAGTRLFRPVRMERLLRALASDRPGAPGLEAEARGEPGGAVGFLERLGRRSYLLAREAARDSPMSRVLGEVAERFGQARRVLSFLTERYLFPVRERWFGFS